jgi:hypothetical protein
MMPKREEFFLSVRTAARLERKPTVTDAEMIDPKAIPQALQRSTRWLTPEIVTHYDPADFTSWPDDLRRELETAVDGFRNAVLPSGPTTSEQFRLGLAAFEQLTSTVRKIVLIDWTLAADAVVGNIEQWSNDFGWRARRQPKMLTETLLGNYSLPQLYVYAEDNLYVLDANARFVPRALGAFDLSLQPSFQLTSIYRRLDGVWCVQLGIGKGFNGGREEVLDKEAFRNSILELRASL